MLSCGVRYWNKVRWWFGLSLVVQWPWVYIVQLRQFLKFFSDKIQRVLWGEGLTPSSVLRDRTWRYLGNHNEVPRITPRLFLCKANALPALLPL